MRNIFGRIGILISLLLLGGCTAKHGCLLSNSYPVTKYCHLGSRGAQEAARAERSRYVVNHGLAENIGTGIAAGMFNSDAGVAGAAGSGDMFRNPWNTESRGMDAFFDTQRRQAEIRKINRRY